MSCAICPTRPDCFAPNFDCASFSIKFYAFSLQFSVVGARSGRDLVNPVKKKRKLGRLFAKFSSPKIAIFLVVFLKKNNRERVVVRSGPYEQLEEKPK